jgi:CheY-like chemotaxis protein/chemotaxis signal transduction protein
LAKVWNRVIIDALPLEYRLGLPHLLLVDDSEAVLALETAALSGHCALSTARDGREALEKMTKLRPACVLLDLSMPQVRGEEVLRRMALEPELARIPVIVVSSESEKAPECLRLGAKAFVSKPFRAEDLLHAVSRLLEEVRQDKERGTLAALFVSVGTLELGLPISCVRSVLHQIATRPLPLGPAYLSEFAELQGEPVLVLDLARRLGVEHAQPVQERKLLVVEVEGLGLALCVDGVRDPEEIPATDRVSRDRLGAADHGSVGLLGMARTERGPVPLLDPAALVSRRLLLELRQTLSGAA